MAEFFDCLLFGTEADLAGVAADNCSEWLADSGAYSGEYGCNCPDCCCV